ncbi:hypothetical protein [Gottfriedia solisilvae]|uniref:hypothetical protein n=1 Tax=Gottfriedia solisilvae TaxID=1516104 RepID=UPI003D2EE663
MEQEITKNLEKIKIDSITFLWSESRLIKDDTVLKTMKDANQLINQVAYECEPEGGYYKTKFIIHWEDGNSYTGRIDVDRSMRIIFNPLREHITDHCQFYGGVKKPSHMAEEDYKNYLNMFDAETSKDLLLFLEKYSLDDIEQPPEGEDPKSSLTEEKENYINSVTYSLNEELNGIELKFSDKPDETTREQLKMNGFRWSKHKSVWYAKQTEKNLRFAEVLSSGNEVTQEDNPGVYEDINIEDLESYTINEELAKREHDSNWIFRKEMKDHNKIIQSYFKSIQDDVIEVLESTDNKYYQMKLKSKLQAFKKKYHKSYINTLSSKASNPSWAVTGRAGRSARANDKAINRQDKLMLEQIELEKDIKSMISKYKNKIRKDKKLEIEKQVKSTEIEITFKTITKEIDIYGNGFKKKVRTYNYNEYMIFHSWAAFGVYKNGKEIHRMKTTERLKDAKQYVQMLVNMEQNNLKAI